MKKILEDIEKREKRNREEKEKSIQNSKELKQRKEEQEAKRLERDEKRKLKEEEQNKLEKEKKQQLEEKEKIEKQKQKEQKEIKFQEDIQKRERSLTYFRMKNKIDEGSHINFDEKKNYWNDLAIKEEKLKQIMLKEKEMRKIKKQQILENQYKSRNSKKNSDSQNNDLISISDRKKQKQTIEDMCIYGDIIKKEIIEEKKNNPEKIISIEEATKNKEKTDSLFVLGLLAKNLEQSGITTIIKKENEEKEGIKDIEESTTSLQFLVNGLAKKKKYNFHFDINEKRNEELLNDKNEQEKFINNLRKKLSKEFNISEDNILITNPQRGSFQLSVIILFQNEDFDLNLDEVKEKFKDEPELVKLKELSKDLLLDGCKLTPGILDARGNNADGGWGFNEKRGGFPYNPPEGWIGYGLNVMDKYDHDMGEKINDWLSYDNREGEWCIAYHGVGYERSSIHVKNAVKGIAKSTLKDKETLKKEANQNGNNNEEEDDIDDEEDHAEDNDMMHPGQKVGKGVYCSPNPKVMEGYAGIIEINNEQYKMGFMLRVNPKKIRIPVGKEDFWVLDGNDDDIRPYRILVKKIEE